MAQLANKELQEKLKKAEELDRSQARQDIKMLVDRPEFMRFFARIMRDLDGFSVNFNPDTNTNYFLQGRQMAAMEIYKKIEDVVGPKTFEVTRHAVKELETVEAPPEKSDD